MDAIELLTSDHKKVKGLSREFEQAGDSAYKTKQLGDETDRLGARMEQRKKELMGAATW